MARRWSVSILEVLSPTMRREHDVTRLVKLKQSTITPSAWGIETENNIFLDFEIDYPLGFVIEEKMELWAGYKDGPNWIEAWFGGFIEMISGGGYAHRHTMNLTLSSFDSLFDTTDVIGWPTSELYQAVTGYPKGFSIADWMVGLKSQNPGLPYDGILPSRLGRTKIVLNGVEPIFYQLMLSDARPGNFGGVRGQWGFTSLRKVLDNMVDVTQWVSRQEVQASYFLRPVIYKNQIVPQFCFIDLSRQTGLEVATFAADYDENAGEWPLEQPFSHDRDAKSIRTRVVVKGIGSDPQYPRNPALPFNEISNPGLLAMYIYEEKVDKYPTWYQVDPGWSGEPILQSEFQTIDQCKALAVRVGDHIWGPKGVIKFPTTRRTLPGEFVRIRDEVEGINRVYPVNSVNVPLDPGNLKYTISAGFRDLTLQDLTNTNAIQLILLQFPTPDYSDNSNQILPGAAALAALDALPTTAAQNTIQPQNQTPGMTFMPNLDMLPQTKAGVPITDPSHQPQVTPPASNNGRRISVPSTKTEDNIDRGMRSGVDLNDPVQKRAYDLRIAALNQSLAAKQLRHLDEGGLVRSSNSWNGVPHPQNYATFFVKDDLSIFTLMEQCELTTVMATPVGAVFTYQFCIKDGDTWLDIIEPTADHPLVGKQGDVLKVMATGVPAGGCGYMITEQVDISKLKRGDPIPA